MSVNLLRHLSMSVTFGLITMASAASLHAQTQQTLSGPDGCSATIYIYGSGNFAGGTINASCPANHTIVVSATVTGSAGGGGSQTNTCTNATQCTAQAGGSAYGSSAQGTYTWSVDGVAGQTGNLTLQ